MKIGRYGRFSRLAVCTAEVESRPCAHDSQVQLEVVLYYQSCRGQLNFSSHVVAGEKGLKKRVAASRVRRSVTSHENMLHDIHLKVTFCMIGHPWLLSIVIMHSCPHTTADPSFIRSQTS